MELRRGCDLKKDKEEGRVSVDSVSKTEESQMVTGPFQERRDQSEIDTVETGKGGGGVDLP